MYCNGEFLAPQARLALAGQEKEKKCRPRRAVKLLCSRTCVSFWVKTGASVHHGDSEKRVCVYSPEGKWTGELPYRKLEPGYR